MARKTFNVKEFVEQANDMLANSTCTPDVRMGMIQMVETVLHGSGNYGGFQYLTARNVPNGHKAGINSNDQGGIGMTSSQKFKDTDDTRRRFFTGQIA